MKIAIIGRTKILYETACRLNASGHEIVCILTAKVAPEYTRGAEDFRKLAEQLSGPLCKLSEDHRLSGLLSCVRGGHCGKHQLFWGNPKRCNGPVPVGHTERPWGGSASLPWQCLPSLGYP